MAKPKAKSQVHLPSQESLKNNEWLAETQGSNITDSSCASFNFRFSKGQLALSKAGRLYFSSSNVILANSLHSRSSKSERDMLVFSLFSPVWLFVTPWTASRQTPQSMGFSSGKNTGVGCQALLQGIFPTKAKTCISCVSCVAGRFFTTESSGKPTS